jgi:hypothetical protein
MHRLSGACDVGPCGLARSTPSFSNKRRIMVMGRTVVSRQSLALSEAAAIFP